MMHLGLMRTKYHAASHPHFALCRRSRGGEAWRREEARPADAAARRPPMGRRAPAGQRDALFPRLRSTRMRAARMPGGRRPDAATPLRTRELLLGPGAGCLWMKHDSAHAGVRSEQNRTAQATPGVADQGLSAAHWHVTRRPRLAKAVHALGRPTSRPDYSAKRPDGYERLHVVHSLRCIGARRGDGTLHFVAGSCRARAVRGGARCSLTSAVASPPAARLPGAGTLGQWRGQARERGGALLEAASGGCAVQTHSARSTACLYSRLEQGVVLCWARAQRVALLLIYACHLLTRRVV